jgi:hypothetical protein
LRLRWTRLINTTMIYEVCLFVLAQRPHCVRAFSLTRFLDHTQRRTTVGRTPLDEWSAYRRDLYLTTHNTHNRQTFMPPVGFKPTISAGEQPQTYALDHAATGTGNNIWSVQGKFGISNTLGGGRLFGKFFTNWIKCKNNGLAKVTLPKLLNYIRKVWYWCLSDIRPAN